jgi:hypothetical protein
MMRGLTTTQMTFSVGNRDSKFLSGTLPMTRSPGDEAVFLCGLPL